MNALPSAAPSSTRSSRVPMLAGLRVLLLSEALLGVALTVFFSLLAAGARDLVGGDPGRETETAIRFAAGGALIWAIFAAVAARGARRRRAWAWTMAAVLQLVLVIGTGVAVMVADWHPFYLVGFAIGAVVMLVLSSGTVRRELGQA